MRVCSAATCLLQRAKLCRSPFPSQTRRFVGAVAHLNRRFQQRRFVRLQFLQRRRLMHQRFFGLLLLTVQTQQALARFRSALPQRIDAHFGLVNLRRACLRSHRQTVHVAGQRRRFRCAAKPRIRSAPSYAIPTPLPARPPCVISAVICPPRPAKFLGALPVERNACSRCDRLRAPSGSDVLVLPNGRVEFVNALIVEDPARSPASECSCACLRLCRRSTLPVACRRAQPRHPARAPYQRASAVRCRASGREFLSTAAPWPPGASASRAASRLRRRCR